MTPFDFTGEQSGEQSGACSGSSPKKLTIGEITLNGLPVLTEVVAASPGSLNEKETQQLLHKLEARLEALFTQKLAVHLEQLQRQAIAQALDELKAELPVLLRDALDEHLQTRM